MGLTMPPSGVLAKRIAGNGRSSVTDLTVGRRLRLLRQQRGCSLQELATSTGLSIGLISQIERGLSSPSVKNLVALGEALGVGISWFFDESVPIDDLDAAFVVRREARRALSMEGDVQKELLTPVPERPLQLYMIVVEPGGSTGKGLYAHSGESAGMVLSGRLALWIDKRHFLLREGDSFSVPANAKRRFANPDPHRPTQLLWAVGRPATAVLGHEA
jgi:transcriptional regulator with XRE-family HTH domain